MSIPLVQNNEKDSINTSIIAIKRNIERINMLLGLVDSGSPDLSGLATKQELENAITQAETDLAPVDEVTLDNMHSVTSNAVSRVCPRFLNYANIITLSSGVTTWQATEDCFVIVNQLTSTGNLSIEIDNIEVGTKDTTLGVTLNSFSGYLKKGQTIKFDYLYNTNITRIFSLI
jgi:hypothetical protein